MIIPGIMASKPYIPQIVTFPYDAHWPMQETSGTVMTDVGPNNLNGTYLASPVLGAPGPMDGITSVFFNQVPNADRAEIPHSIVLNAGIGDYAIECWMRFSNTAYALLWGKFYEDSPFNGPIIFLNTISNTGAGYEGRVFFRESNETGMGIATPFAPGDPNYSDYVWRHWLFQRKVVGGVSTLAIFVNGVKRSEGVMPSLKNHIDTNPVYIAGRATNTLQQMNGNLTQLYWYRRSFTDAEALQLYQSHS